eukprot:TRINITY_DN19788_c0_g1_i2.p1 TRINITY_DN19788_c0_g1~~TRINITY_DN19788_c0_g1_i2.p1  ORF type:complete len:303 (+),score=48.78 TRINITY_DN19788_c0_g1_i2:24-932(+)
MVAKRRTCTRASFLHRSESLHTAHPGLQRIRRMEEALLLCQDLGRALACNLCHNILTDPHSLPCQHHYCHECIHRYVSEPPHSLHCPACSAPFWNKDIKQNYQLANIVLAVIQLTGDISNSRSATQLPASPKSEDEVAVSPTPIQTSQPICGSIEPSIPTTQDLQQLVMRTNQLLAKRAAATSSSFSGSTKPSRFVIAFTALGLEKKSLATSICVSLGAEIEDLQLHVGSYEDGATLSDRVTHLICGCNSERRTRRTLKFFEAIVRNIWVLDFSCKDAVHNSCADSEVLRAGCVWKCWLLAQ